MSRDDAMEQSREELVALVLALSAQNEMLMARVAELERRLGLDSSTSSKPPSSDGLKRKAKPTRTRSLRGPSTKSSGGQAGHKGETLRQVAEPDHTIDHHPETCIGCGAPLTAAMADGHVARQVFDLPQPAALVVTEHRAHACRCAGCGAKTRAVFPEGVRAPVQYGPRIAAFAVYLLNYQLLPEDRLVELMAQLFGVRVCAATLAGMSRACAARLGGFVQHIRELVCGAPVKHMDETGLRIAGKLQWLHVACTAMLTFYRVHTRRGSLLGDVGGVIVHDHWKPYYTMTGVVHGLCNAHHLRELNALVEIEQEGWADAMRRLLRRACHAANLARERGRPLKPGLIHLIERRYDAILAGGLAFHLAQPKLARAGAKTGKKRRGPDPRRTGHNLIDRLVSRKHDTLRFLHDPHVPFTNNQAEGDIRMMKLRQKISGGFRSSQGAEDFAVIRSAISTARKHGWDIIDTIMAQATQLNHDLSCA
jgi:transposase